MKRSWFGLVLLLVLLVGGILSTRYMERSHAVLAENTRKAAVFALGGDWTNAYGLVDDARGKWEKNWQLSAAFADHGPMEKIDGLFARLEMFGAGVDGVQFAAVCGELSEALEAMGDAPGLLWWNIL